LLTVAGGPQVKTKEAKNTDTPHRGAKKKLRRGTKLGI